MDITELGVARREWRRILPSLVAVFVVTRLLVILVAVVVESTLPEAAEPEFVDARPIIRSLTTSDARYYLGIAAEGYHADPVFNEHRDWVFFPLYPATIRVASLATGGDLALAAIIVSNLAFLAAMAVLYALSRIRQSPRTALRSVTYLAILPGAVAFAMAYGESLFLLLSVGAFLAAERRQWGAMGVLLALATLARLPGVLLVIPLLVLQWGMFRRPDRAMAWLLLGPIALGAFAVAQSVALGTTLPFLAGQGTWDIPPLVSDGSGAAAAAWSPLPWILIGTLLGYVFLFVYMRVDRIPAAYVTEALVGVATVLASGRLQSVGRYLAVVFPFAWVLAGRRSRWFRAAWPALSAGLFVLHVALHFTVLAP